MVTPGQLLERPVVIPSVRGLCLDGIYLRGEGPGLLVACPLPGTGSGMGGPVPNELAYAAAQAGRASLRMDYRGVGGSEGLISRELADAVDDLRAGLDFLLESSGGPTLAIAAYDDGCWAALSLAATDERVDRLLLVCPPWSAERPAAAPALQDVVRPTVVAVPGEEKGLNRADLERWLGGAGHARLELLPAEDRALRAGLGALGKLVPPLLGAGGRGRR